MPQLCRRNHQHQHHYRQSYWLKSQPHLQLSPVRLRYPTQPHLQLSPVRLRHPTQPWGLLLFQTQLKMPLLLFQTQLPPLLPRPPWQHQACGASSHSRGLSG